MASTKTIDPVEYEIKTVGKKIWPDATEFIFDAVSPWASPPGRRSEREWRVDATHDGKLLGRITGNSLDQLRAKTNSRYASTIQGISCERRQQLFVLMDTIQLQIIDAEAALAAVPKGNAEVQKVAAEVLKLFHTLRDIDDLIYGE